MDQSAALHDAKFTEMLKKMNITLKPASIPPSFDAADILKSKKCDKVCQNDVLLDELDEFFNSMKKATNTSNSSTSVERMSSAIDTAKNPIKISVDESNGDLIFETNFRRNRNHTAQNAQNSVQSIPAPPSFGFKGSRSLENRVYPEHSSTTSAPSTSNHCNNPYGPVKRRLHDAGNANDFSKKPAFNTNYAPVPTNAENDEQNRFQVQNDFKSASEELLIQYNKKHHNAAATSSTDNFSYNTHPDGGLKRSLGGRRTVNSKFVPPFANKSGNSGTSPSATHDGAAGNISGIDMSHPRLKNVDAKMIENISNEIMDQCDRVGA